MLPSLSRLTLIATDPPLEPSLVTQLQALDAEVRETLAFHPLDVQEASMQNNRRLRLPEVDPEWFRKYDEWQRRQRSSGMTQEQLFQGFRDAIVRTQMRRAIQTSVGRLMESLPVDLKLLILSNPVVVQADDWRGVCNMIQSLCSTSRAMCEDAWSSIGKDLLRIPSKKPRQVAWRVWVKHWCRKLNAHSPWARNLDSDAGAYHMTHEHEFYDVDEEPVPEFGNADRNVFDFDQAECIWRLQHAKPTLFGTDLFLPYGYDNVVPETVQFWPNDSVWMKEALRHDGRFLSIAPEAARRDPDIVRSACASHVNAMRYASDVLRASADFVRGFMFSQPNILRLTTVKNDVQLKEIQDTITRFRDEQVEEYAPNGFDAFEVDEDTRFGIEVVCLKPIDANGTLEVRVEDMFKEYHTFRVDVNGRVDNVNEDTMDVV
jgi:hypothetical protein